MTTTNFDAQMSLYIPRCDARGLPLSHGMNKDDHEAAIADYIGKQFQYQRVGVIDRVDVVDKLTPKGFKYYIAFVHFTHWHDTPKNRQLQEDILGNSRAVLQYHESWFWILNKNKNPLSATEVELAKKLALQEKENERLTKELDNMKTAIADLTDATEDNEPMTIQELMLEEGEIQETFSGLDAADQRSRSIMQPLATPSSVQPIIGSAFTGPPGLVRQTNEPDVWDMPSSRDAIGTFQGGRYICGSYINDNDDGPLHLPPSGSGIDFN